MTVYRNVPPEPDAPSCTRGASMDTGGSPFATPTPSDAGPSGAPVRVAITRTVYSTPSDRGSMRCAVVAVAASRVASYPSPPERHCTRYPSDPATASHDSDSARTRGRTTSPDGAPSTSSSDTTTASDASTPAYPPPAARCTRRPRLSAASASSAARTDTVRALRQLSTSNSTTSCAPAASPSVSASTPAGDDTVTVTTPDGADARRTVYAPSPPSPTRSGPASMTDALPGSASNNRPGASSSDTSTSTSASTPSYPPPPATWRTRAVPCAVSSSSAPARTVTVRALHRAGVNVSTPGDTDTSASPPATTSTDTVIAPPGAAARPTAYVPVSDSARARLAGTTSPGAGPRVTVTA